MNKPSEISLFPKNKIYGSVTPPGSKSITNRLLLLSALSKEKITISNHLISEDSEFMISALKTLGVDIVQNQTQLNIQGCSANFNKNADLFLGNAGTAYRPLCAVLSFLDGEYFLDGIERMHERPIRDLIDSLRKLGAQIEYLKNDGYPPIKISHIKKNDVNEVIVKGNTSSQFLTSLLMAAPLLKKNINIKIDGDLISKPYIDISLDLLKKFNINYSNQNYLYFDYKFSKNNYFSFDQKIIDVEPDASSASYFFAAAAIAGEVEVKGLSLASIQGDIKFLNFIELMGAEVIYKNNSISVRESKKLKGGVFDCIQIPDAAMSLAVLGLFADSPTLLENIKSWKVKETDRILAMKNELEKFGAEVTITENSLKVFPPKKLINYVTVNTYNDHRMAMCFSLLCLGGVNLNIRDPECVKKTYPNYFKDFLNLLR